MFQAQISLLRGKAPSDIREMDEYELERKIASAERNGAFWRYVTVLQFPLTILCIFLFLTQYISGDTFMRVAEIKAPGVYPLEDHADKEFINIGVIFLNLVATYQPAVARDQFEMATRYVADSAFEKFEKEYLQTQLLTAEESGFTQIFTPDLSLVKVRNKEEKVIVRVPGVRERFVRTEPLPPEEVMYTLVFEQGEVTQENEYGLVISDFGVQTKPLRLIAEEDKASKEPERAQPAKKERKLKGRAKEK